MLFILREVLVNLDLPDSALRAAANVAGSQTDTLAEQAVLNAVVALLDAGAFRLAFQTSASIAVCPFLFLAIISSIVMQLRKMLPLLIFRACLQVSSGSYLGQWYFSG